MEELKHGREIKKGRRKTQRRDREKPTKNIACSLLLFFMNKDEAREKKNCKRNDEDTQQDRERKNVRLIGSARSFLQCLTEQVLAMDIRFFLFCLSICVLFASFLFDTRLF